MKIARAFAPATVSNVAVGFDILGFAVKGLGEYASVEKIEKSTEVRIEPVEGYPSLPTDPQKNTATAGLIRLIEEKKLNFGFRVRLEKHIPVGSGLGGSATSAVAALVAANAHLKKKLSPQELLDYAMTGEEIASRSRHADNIGPCIAGGLVFVGIGPEFSMVKIKTPPSLCCVIVLPDTSINTAESRAALLPLVPLERMTEQTANLAGFLIACAKGDFAMMKKHLRDSVIEPQRSKQIPGFKLLKTAALDTGAIGCSISGSGPALFALAPNMTVAKKIQAAFLAMAKSSNISLKGTWVSPISSQGAHLVKGKR